MRRGVYVSTLALLLGACSGDPATNEAQTEAPDAGAHVGLDGSRTEPDGGAEPGTAWVVESPEQHGMDGVRLAGARDYAFQSGKNTQGVVVVRHGVIVAEWYADGADETTYAASWSMAKSFTSALIGIAMNDGLIPSVDVPMTDYIPEWVGTPREDITLRHVLTMSSGLDWIEDYNAMALNSSDIIAMVLNAPDELEYAASQPLLNAPGSTFNYSSGDTMLLSAVIEQATGMTAGEYAAQKLFAPIALDPAEWWRDAANHTLTYCCLDTNSRNFARFGLLYLRNGLWGSTQVVPEAWVAESLAPSPANEGYGYKWWLIGRTNPALPPDTFAARGHDTQRIYVIPSLDLVVVRNGLYVKYVGEPIADPNLFGKYPSSGLVPNQGTSPPDSWIDAEFLTPIVESITP